LKAVSGSLFVRYNLLVFGVSILGLVAYWLLIWELLPKPSSPLLVSVSLLFGVAAFFSTGHLLYYSHFQNLSSLFIVFQLTGMMMVLRRRSRPG